MKIQEIIKTTLASMWTTRYAPRIVYHHCIHPNMSGSLTPKRFAEQLDWLTQNGYEVVTFSELAARLEAGLASHRLVAITFDDGYIDNYEYAFQLLLERKMKATFFVVTSMIADRPLSSREGRCLYPDREMMTKGHVREMAAVGMEVASHTRSHVHVKNVYRRSYQEAWDEVHKSRLELEDILALPITSFAYPNGQLGVFDQNTRHMIQESGYHYAATTMWGPISKDYNVFELPRMEIRETDSLEIFVQKITGRYDFMRMYSQLTDRSRHWNCD